MPQRSQPRNYSAQSRESVADTALHGLRNLLRRANSRSLGAATRLVELVSQRFRKKYLPLPARALISLCQPIDPLRRARNIPAIELVIPFVEKDLAALPIVLAAAKRNIRNPLAIITLITPRGTDGKGPRFSSPESHEALDAILVENPDVRVLYDQDILGAAVLNELNARFGAGDRNAGWVLQQLIKFSAAEQSNEVGALMLDADTVMLSPKTWIRSDKRQLLQIANEYHADFMRHVLMYFGVPKKYRLSFITHHQLMQPEVAREMFPQGSESLLDWWKSSTDPTGRDLSEYETYGSFLAHHYPERVAYGSFGNLFSPHLAKFMRDLKETGLSPEQLIPDYCTVSFHSWAQVPLDNSSE
jgi:hypothetical protein